MVPPAGEVVKKTLAIRTAMGYTISNLDIRGILMDLCCAHNVMFSFGWARFTGFGGFAMERQRV